MPSEIIEGSSYEEVCEKVDAMHAKKVNAWAKGGYKGEYPERPEKRIVSSIASSGSVRAEIAHPYPEQLPNGVKNPFSNKLGGGE
tara:strand:+ start:1442 stop:1696 length:255 start_codon:yes stop_codon:yes gene_type:complete